MIIIVEGIDRVGKSTLCKKIEKEIGFKTFESTYKNFSEMTNEKETEKMIQLLSLSDQLNADIVFDRLYFSDYVYGSIERNYDKTESIKNFVSVDSFAFDLKNDVVLIMVIPTDLKRSSEEHGKDLSKYEEEFEKMFLRSGLKNKFRCTYNTLDEAVTFIRSVKERNNAL